MPATRPVSPATAFGVACIAIALYCGMDACMKSLSLVVGAYNALLWRSLPAVLFSGALFLIRRNPWPDRATLRLHIQRSIAAAISILLFFWGLVRVPLAEGVALAFLSPVFAILLAAPMLGERIRAAAIGASALAFAGVGVIVLGKAEAGAGPDALMGAGAILAASIFYGYNLVLLRRAAQRCGPIEITFFMNLTFLCLFGCAAPVLAHSLPLPELWKVVFAAALGTVSSLMLSWAYAHAEAQRLVTVEYTGFLWSAMLGALVFGEKVLPLTFAGAAMIVAGCIVAVRARDPAAAQTEAAA